ncbi:MAG: hypothetical protein K0S76_2495 [Herbinix sp.]|nr:hypothetical protein [Herbinix sp.]
MGEKMIAIVLSDKAYENDVYPLVKAFYPEETLKVTFMDTVMDHNDTRNENNQDEPHTIMIGFYPNQVSIKFQTEQGIELQQTIDINTVNCSRTQYKNSFKRLLYRMLSERLQKELPWGILTGIRPTKLVYEMLEDNRELHDICTHMKKEYLCSEDKIDMSVRIARREMELLKEIDDRNGYSLYVGIPFCPSTCLYCSFTSYSIEKFSNYVEAYLDALEKEIIFGAGCFPDKKLTTVYLGGGTPTTLSAEQLDRLLKLIRKHFDFTYVKEFCVEAGRPDSITRNKLVVLKENGVDRISINPQSMQQRTLDLIGRKHSVEQIKEAFQLARETGHDNINMDIIIGLPGENLEDVQDTLRQLEELNPESLTVHTLALKRAARLNLEKDSYSDLKANDVTKMLEATIHFAKKHDYLPYYLYRQKNMADNLENIGYAKHGKEGLYNILIMEEQQTILALGAGKKCNGLH